MERTKEAIFTKDYMPYIINRGKWCTRLVLLVAYLPVLVLLFYFDAHPTTDSIFTGMVSMLSILLPWYIVDPISLQSIFGTPGMYLSYMAGNTKEVRVPASTQALSASGYQLGTKEGTIISAIKLSLSALPVIFIVKVFAVLGIFTTLPFGGGYASIIICVITCMLLAKITFSPENKGKNI